jgi:hypothetical protein
MSSRHFELSRSSEGTPQIVVGVDHEEAIVGMFIKDPK